jgi:ribosomal protein S25
MATVHQVSEENLNKVEKFFVSRIKEEGTKRIKATVMDIAEGSEVALATAHKAIKELEKTKVLEIVKPSSRRFPIVYVYKKDIDNFDAKQTQQGQLEYLQESNANLQAEISVLRDTLNKLLVENRNLKQELGRI